MLLSPLFTLTFLYFFFFSFFSLSVAAAYKVETCSDIVTLRHRGDRISITEFGGVGDGKTVNTKAFREAIYRIQHLRRRGGTLLYVPPGVFLTQSFNLTSHMTLYLAAGAVVKATRVTHPSPCIHHSLFLNIYIDFN